MALETRSCNWNDESVSVCNVALTHYCAIEPRALSRHIVDFLESRRMETACAYVH